MFNRLNFEHEIININVIKMNEIPDALAAPLTYVCSFKNIDNLLINCLRIVLRPFPR